MRSTSRACACTIAIFCGLASSAWYWMSCILIPTLSTLSTKRQTGNTVVSQVSQGVSGSLQLTLNAYVTP
jgi:p-aminobenzoyl-glutamate transporter AbgT